MSEHPKKCDCCEWAFWPADEATTCGLCRRGQGREAANHQTEEIDRLVRGYMASEGKQHTCPVPA